MFVSPAPAERAAHESVGVDASELGSSAELGWSGATWAVILVLGFVLVWTFIAGLRFAAWRGERHVARSRRVGERGERRALRLLRRAGYRVLEEQPTGVTRAVVDGELRGFPVRADALVRKRRRVYVAEFKGAEKTARVENRFTRRQLLEYSLAFEADGVLLVDAARGRIIPVRFLGPGALPEEFAEEVADGFGEREEADEFEETYEDVDSGDDEFDDEDGADEPGELARADSRRRPRRVRA